MTQEIRHTQRKYSRDEVLREGEIAYLDSDTIKIGDGQTKFSLLPTFSSNSSSVDNYTTKVDGYNKLQAVGTTNKNNTDVVGPIVYDWVGSVDEYTAQNIGVAHPDWLCFITDDLSGTTSSMYTKAEIDAFLSDKADGQGSAVMVNNSFGDQYIEGNKYFLNGNLKEKSTTIDSTQTPAITEDLPLTTVYDKNGKKIGTINLQQTAQGGAIELGFYASVLKNGNYVYSPAIKTCISQDGNTSWTETSTPANANDNSRKIATTEHIMNVLQAIYPVGSIYIGTQETCPMGAFFGTWELVSSGRALWTGNGTTGDGSNITNGSDYTSSTGATNTISAGLPNIKGYMGGNVTWATNGGAFVNTTSRGTEPHGWDGSSSSRIQYNFDASNSNSIYSDNVTTVQPSAYVVNVWRRTA